MRAARWYSRDAYVGEGAGATNQLHLTPREVRLPGWTGHAGWHNQFLHALGSVLLYSLLLLVLLWLRDSTAVIQMRIVGGTKSSARLVDH